VVLGGRYFDNVKGEPKFQYPRNFLESKFNLNGASTWRHIAMVMDQLTDKVRWYLDGVLAWEGPWGSAVAEADCGCVLPDGSDRFVTLGRSEPGYTYGNGPPLPLPPHPHPPRPPRVLWCWWWGWG
jgi:hypothetical protein